MSEYLVIRLAAEQDDVQWVLTDRDGRRRGTPSAGSLEQAAAAAAQHAVIVLVPATDVLLTTTSLPSRSAAKIRAALPYALEENLAEDVENLHFAIGKKQDNGQIPVAVVATTKLAAWLHRLKDAGIEAQILAAENHGLSKIPGTLSVLVDDGSVLFNDGGDVEFALENLKPSDVLVIAGKLGEVQQEDDEKTGHLVVFCSPEGNEKLSHDWIALRHELHSVDVNVLPDGVMSKLAVTVAAGNGINLLQGQFGKKTEYGPLLRPWGIAATLLLSLALLAVVFKGASFYQLQRDETRLRAQFNAEYRLLQPADSREIVDPIATVQSLRRSAGTSAEPAVFLPSLYELGGALAGTSGAKIEAISYRAGVIDLRLTASDVATLDNIQKAVSASGRFQASIQSTDQVADKIAGRIQIRKAGP